MPTNFLKEYPELLEILHLPADKRKESLLKIFKRDIEGNEDFKFRGVQIYPIKTDMAREFMHLTTEEVEDIDENGVKQAKKRVFDMHRSQRLHWINHHIHERIPENIDIFSVVERDTNKRQDITKTYMVFPPYRILSDQTVCRKTVAEENEKTSWRSYIKDAGLGPISR